MSSWRSSRTLIMTLALCGAFVIVSSLPSLAQVTPATGSTPADDTPSVKVGGVIFADYTYQAEPKSGTGADVFNPSSFNIGRAYINITGNVSHLVSFRVTPDVKQETKATGTDLNGNYIVRLKYAYGQLNLDDWLPKGSWVRLGMQQTPYVDYEDSIYRYRFQGKIMPDREKFISSSDAGLSARIAFPKNYGDVHFGYYNGETYEAPELNDQKATEIRVSVRPTPMTPFFKGFRLAGFVLSDSPVKGGKRNRTIGLVTFEHERVNVGAEYMDASDKATSTATEYHSTGWSLWATPKLGAGFEALLRYDFVKLPSQGVPSKGLIGRNRRMIAGVSYWFPVQKGVTSAVMLDVDRVKYDDYKPTSVGPKPDDRKYYLHALFSF